MPRKRRKFQRPLGKRRYRRLFVIAVEGVKTEPHYFAIFNDQYRVIRLRCLKGRHDSSPPQVLKRMEDHLKQNNLLGSDEAWLVVDKDQWTDIQLKQLHTWSQGAENYGFALSNPKFEYWLLLHFEDGAGIGSSRECSVRLKQHIPDYDKELDPRKIAIEMINNAILRARARDNPPCDDWPHAIGGTTVYRLVERILQT
jgi:hypothetical protein